MKKLHLIPLLGIALMYAACSKDDQQDQNKPPIDPVEESLFVTSMASGLDSFVFNYNADKTVKEASHYLFQNAGQPPSVYAVFPYWENGKLKDFYAVNEQNQPGELLHILVFDSVGIVGKVLFTPGTNGHDSLTFDQAGHLVRRATYYDDIYGDDTTQPDFISTYTWQGDDLVKEEKLTVAYNTVVTRTYKYDDKKNPFLTAAWSMYEESDDFDFYPSAHNIIEAKNVDEYSEVTVTYTYTYNDKGYPLTRTSKTVIVPEPATPYLLDTTYRFTYLPQ